MNLHKKNTILYIWAHYSNNLEMLSRLNQTSYGQSHSLPMAMIMIKMIALLLLVTAIESQVQRTGQFVSSARQIYYSKARVIENIKGIKFTVPFQNSTLLLEAEERKKTKSNPPIEMKELHSEPLTFAKAVSVSIDSRIHGVWQDDLNTNLRTWNIIIESKSALSLSLIFEHFQLPSNGEMYIFTPSAFAGAFNMLSNTHDGKFSIQPIRGSNIYVLYVEPLNLPKALKYLKISQVVHGFRDIFRFNAPFVEKDISGSCNVDVRCVNSFIDQRRAVALLMTDQLQKFCTGVMLNNAKNDGRQLLLTANHCVFADLSNSITGFNYERLGCGPGAPISDVQTAHGLKYIKQDSPSDFAIFEVVEMIPRSYNVYLAGWDANPPDTSHTVTYAGIHHPSGDVKKISLFTGPLQMTNWSEGPDNKYHIAIQKWSSGTTEPGSSGSPLFSPAGNVIGQLHGGASACSNLDGTDIYGAIQYSFAGSEGQGSGLNTILDPNGIVRSKILSGRNLYNPISSVTTTASTVTVTSVQTHTFISTMTLTTSTCACVPKDIVDKLIGSYEKCNLKCM